MLDVEKAPYERWIKALLIGKGYSVSVSESLFTAIRLSGFPLPTRGYLARLTKDLKADQPSPSSAVECEAWLRRHRIKSLVLGEVDASEALGLVQNRELHKVLDYLLASSCEPTHVCEVVMTIMGRSIRPEVMAVYRHYFADFSQMGMEECKEYFDAFPRPDSTDLYTCYRKKSKLFALWKLGYDFEVDREDIFRQMFREASLRFLETKDMENDATTARAAKTWSEVAMAADDKLSGGSAELRALLNELQNLGIRLGARAISSIDTVRKTPPKDTPE